MTNYGYDQVRDKNGKVLRCQHCDEVLDVSNVCAAHTFTSLLCDAHCECNESDNLSDSNAE